MRHRYRWETCETAPGQHPDDLGMDKAPDGWKVNFADPDKGAWRPISASVASAPYSATRTIVVWERRLLRASVKQPAPPALEAP